ncbi:MAG: glycosyltransferase [Bacteroidales bacterium]|nr:glycosyltransferase [Bacteroidales bacterium]
MFDFSYFLSDTYSVALAAVMLAAMIYLCVYYGLYHFRVGLWHLKTERSRVKGENEPTPPVSVVLTARNDAAWLKENLVYLLEQDYPDFEVVVVDYLSNDDTEFVLKLLKDYYPHLKVVPFKEDVNLFQGKKYPLSIGIKSAKNDILMLADPDCTPKNLLWLRGMVRGFMKEGTQVVLGYCGVKRTKTLLGCLQQYDALAYGAQYLGSALLGHPYTGSGRNLSYRRSFFFRQGAFIRHYDVADGSDDLFVYQNADRKNTSICIDSDACLMAEPRKHFYQWHDDRRHRVATRNRHRLSDRLCESLPGWMNILFYAAAVLLVLRGMLPWIAVLAALLIKWAWQIFSFSRLTKRFEGGHVHFAAPLFEIYFAIANTILILLPLPNNRKFKK